MFLSPTDINNFEGVCRVLYYGLNFLIKYGTPFGVNTRHMHCLFINRFYRKYRQCLLEKMAKNWLSDHYKLYLVKVISSHGCLQINNILKIPKYKGSNSSEVGPK